LHGWPDLFRKTGDRRDIAQHVDRGQPHLPIADKYWNARGGSSTDGGSFIFTLEKGETGKYRMSCTDKFGVPVKLPSGAKSLIYLKK
jgi:hypothetical protein